MTATARNGGPISCPTPARSTRSSPTPPAGSGSLVALVDAVVDRVRALNERGYSPASPRRQSHDLVRGERAGGGGVDLDLRRRVADPELMRQVFRQPMQEGVARVPSGHDQMAGERRFGRANRPDVQIV